MSGIGVFVALQTPHGETSNVLGVFANERAAMAACDAIRVADDETWMDRYRLTVVSSTLAPIAHPIPPRDAALKCLVCGRIEPWGTFDPTTGAAACVVCRDAGQLARLSAIPSAPERGAETTALATFRTALLGVCPDPDEPRSVQPIGAITAVVAYAEEMLTKHYAAETDPQAVNEAIADARYALAVLHDGLDLSTPAAREGTEPTEGST